MDRQCVRGMIIHFQAHRCCYFYKVGHYTRCISVEWRLSPLLQNHEVICHKICLIFYKEYKVKKKSHKHIWDPRLKNIKTHFNHHNTKPEEAIKHIFFNAVTQNTPICINIICMYPNKTMDINKNNTEWVSPHVSYHLASKHLIDNGSNIYVYNLHFRTWSNLGEDYLHPIQKIFHTEPVLPDHYHHNQWWATLPLPSLNFRTIPTCPSSNCITYVN